MAVVQLLHRLPEQPLLYLLHQAANITTKTFFLSIGSRHSDYCHPMGKSRMFSFPGHKLDVVYQSKKLGKSGL